MVKEMKLLLTSFGANLQMFGSFPHDGLPEGRPQWSEEQGLAEYFLCMPPVSMATVGPRFVPDITTFLLFDRFIIDAKSLDRMHRIRRDSYFADMSMLFRELEQMGRLDVVDYSAALSDHKSTIEAAVDYDLRHIEMWTDAFCELTQRWAAFTEKGNAHISHIETSRKLTSEEEDLKKIFDGWVMGMFPISEGILQIMRNWKRQCADHMRARTRAAVRMYLEYVSCNMCLANVLDAAIYDWHDIEPLYQKKFNLCLKTDDSAYVDKGRKLFELLCPSFEKMDAKALLAFISDKRIESLRELLAAAVSSGEHLDEDFVNRTFREVVKAQVRQDRQRRLIGWLSLPLDFIPIVGTPVQKVVEESAMKLLSRNFERQYRWFFLLHDIESADGRMSNPWSKKWWA